MGQFKEKVAEHFYLYIFTSKKEIENPKGFKDRYEPIFKIKENEALKLLLDKIWTKLYNNLIKFDDPDHLKKHIELIAKFDVDKIKKDPFSFIFFTLKGIQSEKTFREYYEPIIRFNSKEIVKYMEKDLWQILYDLSRQAKDRDDMIKHLSPLINLDINRALEMIKSVNPEKHELLLMMK
ncbi:hypothetical protein [Candidatus Hodarchaeum mangrovi]